MKTTLCRSCLFTASLLVLPGCLVINAVLSVAGLLGSGPIEYAGTAYSVGEYAYHYTVNDKTPDEVIEEKLARFMPDDAATEDGETPVLVADASASAASAVGAPEAEVSARTASLPRLGEAPPNPAVASLPPVEVRAVAEVRVPASRPEPVLSEQGASPPTEAVSVPPAHKPVRVASVGKTRPAKGVSPVRQAAPVTESPVSESLSDSASEPDPLLTRLNRLELAFAQAERVSLSRPASGVRGVASSEDAGQTGSVSGSWSIRHPVMEAAPSPGPPPTAQLGVHFRYM